MTPEEAAVWMVVAVAVVIIGLAGVIYTVAVWIDARTR